MRKNIVALLGLGLLSTSMLTGCAQDNTPAVTPVAPISDAVAVAITDDMPAKHADIIVIGAGGAGMSAAVQAYQAGASNIVVIEKMPMTGGNTVRATGGMNAAGTPYQEEGDDNADLMFEDTMRGGGYLNDEALVRIMADESAAAVAWLNDLGAGITRVGRAGGASAARAHGPADGAAVGPAVTLTLTQELRDLGIPVMLNTTVTEILLTDGSVSGVVARQGDQYIVVNAPAVVLAAGGFGANSDMLVANDPDLEGFGTTNHSGATGSGIMVAYNIGADLVHMYHIQTHPTVHPTTSIMYTEAMRGEGAILVNLEGERFVNELGTRDMVSEATLSQTENVSLLLFDSRIRGNLAVIESYVNAGIIYYGNSPEALAEALGIDPAALAATIANYNAIVDAGVDNEFGRTASMHRLEGPYFYAGFNAPAVHHTMGGVRINTYTEVLDTDGYVIPGLFAAGEVVGGIHGNNRLGGSAVADIVVFGRIAGENAVAYVQETTGFTERTIVIEVAEHVIGAQGDFTDGVFEGSAFVFGGNLTVQVTVEGGNVVSIELINHNETPGFYNSALDSVRAGVIGNQTLDIDIAAGATVTGTALLEALAEALQ